MINFIKIINFSSLQKFSKALRVPISILPVSCLLIGIGSVFSNSSSIVYVDKIFIQNVLGLMKAIGNAILLNMPLIFLLEFLLELQEWGREQRLWEVLLVI